MKATPEQALRNAQAREADALWWLYAAAERYAKYGDAATKEELAVSAKRWTNASHQTSRCRKHIDDAAKARLREPWVRNRDVQRGL